MKTRHATPNRCSWCGAIQNASFRFLPALWTLTRNERLSLNMFGFNEHQLRKQICPLLQGQQICRIENEAVVSFFVTNSSYFLCDSAPCDVFRSLINCLQWNRASKVQPRSSASVTDPCAPTILRTELPIEFTGPNIIRRQKIFHQILNKVLRLNSFDERRRLSFDFLWQSCRDTNVVCIDSARWYLWIRLDMGDEKGACPIDGNDPNHEKHFNSSSSKSSLHFEVTVFLAQSFWLLASGDCDTRK